MPNLLDVIQVIPDDVPELEPEDIFASAPSLMFQSELGNSHGDPTCSIMYKSARYGNLELRTADPSGKENRQLFAHLLWNAGIRMAELVSREDDEKWSVRGQTVIELGAGVGLAGIVSALASAKEVVISDYPTDSLIENIQRNVDKALAAQQPSRCSVQGYTWGDVTSPFAVSNAGHFTRVIAADCFWMPWEHKNLALSMLHLLNSDPSSRVYAVAGFHTGRAKLTAFFDVAESVGLCIDEIYEENTEGQTREWMRERENDPESEGDRKRWLVVSRLRRRRSEDAP